MKYEIDIEGLCPEWEPVSFLVGNAEGKDFVYGRLQVRRKVRKYDWSKTLNDVLITRADVAGYWPLGRCATYREAVADSIWQPNIHGKCPVDGEACIVRVMFNDGSEVEGLAAWIWDTYDSDTIRAYKFIRLADGWEF